MDSTLLEINLFGACSIRSSAAEEVEIAGAKHKALFVLLATAPFGRRTRSFRQETRWGVGYYDTGRRSLCRALADIKTLMVIASGARDEHQFGVMPPRAAECVVASTASR